MSKKRYSLDYLFTEKLGEIEVYREDVKGCILYDSVAIRYYRLDGELAEYYLSKLLKNECSLSSILTNRKIKAALSSFRLRKIGNDNWKKYITSYTKLDDIKNEELDVLAEKSKSIWNWKCSVAVAIVVLLTLVMCIMSVYAVFGAMYISGLFFIG